MPSVPVNVMMSKTKEILGLVTAHHTTGCSIFIWSFIDVLQANIMMDSKVLFTTNDVLSQRKFPELCDKRILDDIFFFSTIVFSFATVKKCVAGGGA